ncbi:DNA-methyltransferase [Actinomadura sp. 3N508]|uniref:DNA-methyltransferase n=1 Tax=Actinomadura sp. 3N508 TaxID=3375153 RepID=UPI0037AA079E
MKLPQRGLPRNEVLVGDARAQLASLPASSVDCVITSPPYFALRDYGQPEQLGLETNIEAWVQNLLNVTAGIWRVLKPSGSFWLNLGDSYAHHHREGASKKSLLMGPERLALAMLHKGWLLRNRVVWAKTNPMPSNVTDRLSATHESVFFFTKSSRYFFDLNAIRVPHKDDRAHTSRYAKSNRSYPPKGVLPRRTDRGQNINNGLSKLGAADLPGHPLGKNPGDVWPIGTASYHGNHFATFPTKLVERPLLATCPARICESCGQPWQRSKQRLHGRILATGAWRPSCACDAGWRSGIVLDPFFGAGTVAIVAETYERDWLGVELNQTYAQLALGRLAAWRATRESTA